MVAEACRLGKRDVSESSLENDGTRPLYKRGFYLRLVGIPTYFRAAKPVSVVIVSTDHCLGIATGNALYEA